MLTLPVPKVAKVGTIPSSCHLRVKALPAVTTVAATGAVKLTEAEATAIEANKVDRAKSMLN